MYQDDGRSAQHRPQGVTRLREQLLFLRRSLAHPLATSALLPSPRVLGDLITGCLPDAGGRFILEIGAGTGAVSTALADAVPEERLLLVEMDEELCAWLRQRFPRATVLCGDALELGRLLPEECRSGNVAAIVSGIPVTRFSIEAKRAFVAQCFDVVMPGGGLMQYTYSPVPPLPCRQLGLEASRIGATLRSPLPMFLWRFGRRPG